MTRDLAKYLSGTLPKRIGVHISDVKNCVGPVHPALESPDLSHGMGRQTSSLRFLRVPRPTVLNRPHRTGLSELHLRLHTPICCCCPHHDDDDSVNRSPHHTGKRDTGRGGRDGVTDGYGADRRTSTSTTAQWMYSVLASLRPTPLLNAWLDPTCPLRR